MTIPSKFKLGERVSVRWDDLRFGVIQGSTVPLYSGESYVRYLVRWYERSRDGGGIFLETGWIEESLLQKAYPANVFMTWNGKHE